MKKRFVVKQIEIHEYILNKMVTSMKTFICFIDYKTGIAIPHPITSFLESKFTNSTKSLNTVKKYA